MHPTPTWCDGTAAALLITAPGGELLLTERASPPLGLAPPTAHLSDYSVDQPTMSDAFPAVAVAHAERLTGLTIDRGSVRMVLNRMATTPCVRPLAPGHHHPGHHWRAFTATATGHLFPSPTDTRGATWYNRGQLYAVANQTLRLVRGELPALEFTYRPGLEPTWLWWLHLLGYLPDVDERDARAAFQLAERGGVTDDR